MDRIRRAQLDYVFQQLKITGLPHALAVTVTAGVIYFNSGSPSIFLWFVVIQASHILRIKFLDPMWGSALQQNDFLLIERMLVLGMFMIGCTWSVIPLFYMSDMGSEIFIFCSIALAGMMCATLPALAAYLPGYLAFALPILLTLAWRYYSLGLASSAFLTIAFLGSVVGISRVLNQIVTRSITMDFENARLLEEVTSAKEQAELANQDKSRFLAAASHDLRQPLQGLGLILESLRLRLSKSQGDKLGLNQAGLHQLVEQGLRSHQSMSDLFNSILELSQLESSKTNVELLPFSMQQLITPVVTEFRYQAAEKGLYLDANLQDAQIYSDPVMVSRIVRNLLSSAIKFTETGGVTLACGVFNGRGELVVSDTGIGIAQDQAEKIFDEYHQVANKERNKQAGIGLGLSVVRKMCDLLGATVCVKSQLGSGAQFTVTFPLAQGEPEIESIKKAKQNSNVILKTDCSERSVLPFSTHGDLADKTVLLVEDDAQLREALFGMLTDWGCGCIAAHDYASGLERMQGSVRVPDLILSDYRLPNEKNGVQLIAEARNQLNRKVPAILLSGETDPAQVDAIHKEAIPLLLKPIGAQDLLDTIVDVLQEHQC